MSPFWTGFEKRAFLGIGASVLSSKDKKHHLSIGFPYGVGYDYKLGDKDGGWSPTVGLGFTGPRIGMMKLPSALKKRLEDRKNWVNSPPAHTEKMSDKEFAAWVRTPDAAEYVKTEASE